MLEKQLCLGQRDFNNNSLHNVRLFRCNLISATVVGEICQAFYTEQRKPSPTRYKHTTENSQDGNLVNWKQTAKGNKQLLTTSIGWKQKLHGLSELPAHFLSHHQKCLCSYFRF